MPKASKRVKAIQNLIGGSTTTIDRLLYILDTYTEEQYDSFTEQLGQKATTLKREYERAKLIRALKKESDPGI